jgi:hypothetical protein
MVHLEVAAWFVQDTLKGKIVGGVRSKEKNSFRPRNLMDMPSFRF